MNYSLKDYQIDTRDTRAYPDEYAVVYPALGLAGEAGEVANRIKKSLRGGTDFDIVKVAEELGDVMWYVAALCDDLGISLEDVCRENIAKLARRQAANDIRSVDHADQQ